MLPPLTSARAGCLPASDCIRFSLFCLELWGGVNCQLRMRDLQNALGHHQNASARLLSLLTYTGSMLARLLAGDWQYALDMAVRRPSESWALTA